MTYHTRNRVIGEDVLDTITQQDKMVFGILKWIFDAIKQVDETFIDDEGFVDKTELHDQLSKNPQIIAALGFNDVEEVKVAMDETETQTFGQINWAEFLDFFFSKTATETEIENDPWWKRLCEKNEFAIENEDENAAKRTT